MAVELQTYTIYFFITLVSTLLLRSLLASFASSKGQHLPPGPVALPIIGHLHLLGAIPHQSLHRLSLRHGPLMRILLGFVPCVIASDADMAREFLKTHELHFAYRPMSYAVSFLSFGSADFVFAPYGPFWKFMKKLSMLELLGSRTLDQHLHVRQDEIRKLIGIVLRSSGKPMDIGAELATLTNNVVSRMAMGRTCMGNEEGDAEEVRQVVEEVMQLIGMFNLSDYVSICKNLDLQGFKRRCTKVMQKINAIMDKVIREKLQERRMEGGDKEGRVRDILDILLDTAEDEKAEVKISKENIKAFILDIFVAGTDTSSITASWALAELINQPCILKKAAAEIESIVGKDRLVEESDIEDLPYVQAIFKETLRLHPAGPLISRESNYDCTVNGYHIPAGTRLYVNVWAIGRDPKHWEEPLVFKPERFMPDQDGKWSKVDVRGQHYHFIPFGSGRRGCPGTSLAMQLMQTTLAVLIQCFDWKASGIQEEGGKVDMTEGTGITLPRANPLVCVPIARLNPFPSLE